MSYLLDTSQCAERSFITRPIVNCIPAWIRFAQCLRRYRDSKEAFPHLVNAGKYSTTFFVVIFATLRAYHASKSHKMITIAAVTISTDLDTFIAVLIYFR